MEEVKGPSPVKKVLIVDDEADICFFLSRNLTKRGFTTSSTNSIAEAEKELELTKPEIVLLDNHLPDGKGIDFVTDIATKYPETKIIMMTAHDTPQDRLRAYNNGVSFFIAKPFTLAAVNQIVDMVVFG
ncbi:MAG: response regulator [Ferruginibacter sp.]|nr:response regulator [Chitinophagaceae bacterium]